MSLRTLALATAMWAGTLGCAAVTPTPSPTPARPPPVTWLALLPSSLRGLPVVEVLVSVAADAPDGAPAAGDGRTEEHVLRAVLDTGATSSAIADDVAMGLRLPTTGLQETVRDAGGASAVLEQFAVKLTIGNRAASLHATPMQRVGDVDLIIGRDFLDGVELFLPARQPRLGLFAPGAGPRGGMRPLVLNRERDGLFTQVTAKRQSGAPLSFAALVDTGATRSRVRVLDLEGPRDAGPATGHGQGALGPVAARGAVSLTDVRVGGVGVGALRINVDDVTDAPPLLGMDVWGLFDVLIDTRAGLMWVGPLAPAPQS